jgi:hypothetical protein
MKAITLRNIPPDVARAVQRRASQEGQSLNKAVLELVAEGAGLKMTRHRPGNHDFDEFVGRWSKREADAFDRHLRKLRKIDPELWK